MTDWDLKSSSSDVLDALSLWLEHHEAGEYRVSFHPDYHVKKWHAVLTPGPDARGDVSMSYNGRGDSPHEATVDAFKLAEVPRPGIKSRTSIFDRNLNPAGPDRHA